MSFILDALKKSEAERQRQQVPGLMDSGMRTRRRRLPAWAIIICVLLGINVLILGAMLLRQQTPVAPPPPSSPAPAKPAPQPPHFSPMDSAPVYAPEIPVDEPDTNTRPAPSAAPAATRAAEKNAQDDEVLPDISQVSLSDGQTLPELHLDVHVYATRPADRFVYINMRKYREGAVLPEGVSVERIRRDGVVLSYQGLRFLLPRQ